MKQINQPIVISYIFIFLLALIWGVNFLFIKIAVLEISPVNNVFLRLILASTILYFYMRFTGNRLQLSINYLFFYFVIGALGNAIPFFLISTAEINIDAGITGVLMSPMPLITLALSAIILRDPEKYGFKIPRSNPLKYDEVVIEKSADLTVLAKAAGTKRSTIQRLNPELRQPATPSNGSYNLNIPFGKKDSFYKKFNALPDEQKFAVQKIEHRVRKGENFISIASKYRVSVADLQTINNISNINKLSIGQRLKIPVKGGVYSNYPEKIIYKVKSGDTLGHIAEKYNTRAAEIRKWNNMGNTSNIYPNQKLSLFVNTKPDKDTPSKNVYIVYFTVSSTKDRNFFFFTIMK